MSRLPRRGDERGSAIVEFHFLGILLLVPLVYVLLSALEVQRAAYGVTQAAREAGRVFTREGDADRARYAASVALDDQGLPADAVAVRLSCARQPCFSPGNRVQVTVSAQAQLPLLPDVFAGAVNAAIPVSATHVAVVDTFREFH